MLISVQLKKNNYLDWWNSEMHKVTLDYTAKTFIYLVETAAMEVTANETLLKRSQYENQQVHNFRAEN